MPRTKTLPVPIPAHGAAPPQLVQLLTDIAILSLEQKDDVIAMLEELRRTSPRDYIAAMVAIAKLGQEIPQHAPQFTVLSAIPRSRLDELPPHMQEEQEKVVN